MCIYMVFLFVVILFLQSYTKLLDILSHFHVMSNFILIISCIIDKLFIQSHICRSAITLQRYLYHHNHNHPQRKGLGIPLNNNIPPYGTIIIGYIYPFTVHYAFGIYPVIFNKEKGRFQYVILKILTSVILFKDIYQSNVRLTKNNFFINFVGRKSTPV